MRVLTSISFVAIALSLGLLSGVGNSSIVSIAYAKSSRSDTQHGAGYQAPIDERKLNCKQLTGRSKVLILQLRGYADRKQASRLSRGLQSALSATVGATGTGSDPAGQYATDIKRLQDYNQRLVAQGCRSFDLDHELKQTDPMVSPEARIPAVKKSKTKAAPAPVQQKQP